MQTQVEPKATMERNDLVDTFLRIREKSEELVRPLEREDFVIQTIDDVSPPKWHLGHTTWFFERVILQQYEKDFAPINETYYYVFNSYYNTFGCRLERDRRGTLSRPALDDVFAYRKAVTERTVELLNNLDDNQLAELIPLLLIGCNHEQQHQELFLMDIKHIYNSNPFHPPYRKEAVSSANTIPELTFLPFEGGLVEIGCDGTGFAYDNEFPRHKHYLHPFKIANRPVTNGEFLNFINDGGYHDHRWWLSDAWDYIQQKGWEMPLYWEKNDHGYLQHTLAGTDKLNLNEPVVHVSFYEAAAYARWADKRLPTEFEWEIVAQKHGHENPGNLMDDGTFHPFFREGNADGEMHGLIGDTWEWTRSSYLPYPGYKQGRDALGEYNGKFMNNQRVLRGGCCATPADHIRITYRNFFQPEKRWQFSGFRLADDA